MRHALILAGLALAPFSALAADMPASAKDWHLCQTDYDCVVVPGICGEAAVNPSFEAEATQYYKEQAATTKCPQMFWKQDGGKARCRLEACEIVLN